MTSISKQTTMLDHLPGVSYLPDKIEIEIGDEIVSSVVKEFLDFLRSLTDLMKLMHSVKTKHLRSLNPMPCALIREVMTQDAHGPLFKAWDKTCSGDIPGISSSAEHLFKLGHSTANVSSARAKPVLRNKEQQKKRKVGLDNDLIEVVGKKTKPLWHVVALEAPPEEIHRILDAKDSHHNLDEDRFALLGLLDHRARPIHRSKSEQLLVNINAVRAANVNSTNPKYQTQMDMLLARDAGFTSIADHKAYLDTLKPHWYKDMVVEAHKMGILYNKEVVLAFEALGRYYETTKTCIQHAKAKLCFLMMSMPVWDVCQLAMQKAADVPTGNNTLAEWLRSRKLPYLVEPPLSPEINFLTGAYREEQVQEAEVEAEPEVEAEDTS